MIVTPEAVKNALDFAAFFQAEVGELKPGTNGNHQALCPFHEDSAPSLSVNLQTGLYRCFGCQAKGDVFDFYRAKHGCGFKEALEALAQIAGVEETPRPKAKQNSKGKLVATYDYEVANGKLVFQVCRFQTPTDKTFSQRRPDGSGGWIWDLKGVDRIPYRLPRVLEAETVFVVEGEKDVHSLEALGFTATCNPGGAMKWRPEYNPHFQGKAVVIPPDNDPPGKAHAFDVARNLHGVATSVKVVELPDLPEKGDVSDWISAGGTKEQLLALVEAAPEYDPTTASAPDPEEKSLAPNNDPKTEIAQLTQDLTPDTSLIDKLKNLAPLAPLLAKLSNLEAAAIMEELRARLKLRAADLGSLKADIKAARKFQEKKGDAANLVVNDLEENHRLHPAIDFLGEIMTIGFRVSLPENETGLVLISSDGKAEINPEILQIGEQSYQVPKKSSPPFLRDVWGLENIKKFLDHPTRPKDLYGDLVRRLKTFLDLQDPTYGLMAAWTVGTYYAHLFTAFPFLHFHGPKESGKSKSLEALRCVCFNAWKGRDISPAALGDTADSMRGTLLLDQAEKLNNDKENSLIGLLADSYKKAGGQRRVVEVTKAGRSVLEFSTYGPKAFASTKELDPDLKDRCIKIPMTRTRKRLPDLEGWEQVWGELRDKLYRYTLAAFKEVRQHYEANPGNGTRIGELWRPLLAVLLALGVEQGEIKAIRSLFMEAAQEGRHELTSWEIALFEALKTESEMATGPFDMSAQEIIETMALGEEGPGPKWIGEALSRFYLFMSRKQLRAGGKRTRVYEFSPSRVRELCEIYFRDTPPNDLCHLCQDGKASKEAGERGTGEKCVTCANLCHSEGKEQVEQVGTCDNKNICDKETPTNSDFPGVSQVEQVKIGGVEEKLSHFFDGGEVEL